MDLNSRSSYSLYKSKSKNPIDIKIYLKIVNEFMIFISKKLINNGELILPERMGILQIRGRKQKPKVVDGKIKNIGVNWIETKELWEKDENAKKNKQLIYYFNENSNGILYRTNWYRRRVLAANKSIYDFTLTRTNKRAIAKKIKEDSIEYLIL